MKKMILGFLASMYLFPAASFANDFHPWWRASRYESNYREPLPPYRPTPNGFWHLHRVRRRDGRGYDYFYHWHRTAAFYPRDDRWDRPRYGFED